MKSMEKNDKTMDKFYSDLLCLKAEMQYRGYSSSTQNTYVKTVQDFLEVTDKEIIFIKREDVIKYLDKNLSLVSENTVLVKLNALQFFFEEVLGLNITENIKKYKRQFKKKGFITLDQFEMLIASVMEREQLVYKIIKEIGMIAEDICTLEITDIKYGESQCKLRGFDISRELARDLLTYADRKYCEKYLFEDQTGGHIESAALRYWNRENTKKILGERYTFNEIKHSLALELYLKRGDEKGAAKYLKMKEIAAIRQYYRRAGYDYR